MPSKEEIRVRAEKEANELLAESIDLAGQLGDQMAFLLKTQKEKFTQDKNSAEITKKVLGLTKNLSSEYSSIKDIEKDMAKNKKLQNELARQQISLEKTIGQEGLDRISYLKQQQELEKQLVEQLSEARAEEEMGVTGAKDRANALADQVKSQRTSLADLQNSLTSEEHQLLLLEQTSKVLGSNNELLEEQKRRQENIEKAMGTIGRTVESTSKVLNKMGLENTFLGKTFSSLTEKIKKNATEATNGGKEQLSAFGKLKIAAQSFGQVLKSALSPMGLILAAIGAVVNAYRKGEEAAKRLNDENVDFSRNLGVSQKTANKLLGDVRGIGASMGITGGQATAAAGAIYSALDGAEKLSRNTLATFMKLNVFAGMSADSIAGIQKFSKLAGEDAGKVADEMASTAQESIKANKVNVSMRSVMDGVAKQSAILKLNFGGSAKGLTEAFVQSKKLGLELSKVEDIANSLLNIEDSIGAEMEAELLTGKELNLEKAREAALNNDTKGLMTEIANQFGSIEDFQKMNRVQQEAFAKSIGMSRDGLAEMLVTSKENAAANTDMVSEQDKSLAAMQSMAKTSEVMAAREEARANQFAKIFELLHPIVELFKELGPLVLQLITPIVEQLAPILKSFMETLLPVIKDIFSSLAPIITEIIIAIKPILEVLVQMAQEFLPIIADLFREFSPIITDLIKTLSPIIVMLADAAKDLLPIIANLFKQLIPIVADIVKQLMPIITEILNAIMPILKPILDVFVEIARIIVPILIDLLKGIMPILKPILTVFQGIAEIIGGILKGDWSAVANGLKKIGEGILNLVIGLFESLINLPIKAINAMLDYVPGLGPDTIPKVELPRVKFAEGGIVNKPTNALIGEAGPEAVVPLNSDKSMNINTKALEAKIDKLISIIEKGGDVYMDGTKVGKSLMLAGYRM